jgi:hypothetical protein
VVECGKRSRFALQPAEKFGVTRDVLWEDLQRDIAIERRIARAIDLAHAARAYGSGHCIRPDARAG